MNSESTTSQDSDGDSTANPESTESQNDGNSMSSGTTGTQDDDSLMSTQITADADHAVKALTKDIHDVAIALSSRTLANRLSDEAFRDFFADFKKYLQEYLGYFENFMLLHNDSSTRGTADTESFLKSLAVDLMARFQESRRLQKQDDFERSLYEAWNRLHIFCKDQVDHPSSASQMKQELVKELMRFLKDVVASMSKSEDQATGRFDRSASTSQGNGEAQGATRSDRANNIGPNQLTPTGLMPSSSASLFTAMAPSSLPGSQ